MAKPRATTLASAAWAAAGGPRDYLRASESANVRAFVAESAGAVAMKARLPFPGLAALGGDAVGVPLPGVRFRIRPQAEPATVAA